MFNITFKNLSVKYKVVAVVLPLVLALLIALASFFLVSDRASERRSVSQSVYAQTNTIANSLSDALFSSDYLLLQYQLQHVNLITHIDEAVVFNHQNEIIARFATAGFSNDKSLFSDLPRNATRWSDVNHGDVVFSDDGIHVFAAITKHGNTMGTVYIRYQPTIYSAFDSSLQLLLVIVFLATLAVLLMLMTPLLNWLQVPIKRVYQAMNALKQDSHYDSPVPVYFNDELGQLSSEFNELLAELHQREKMVHRHELELEIEADERTKALQESNASLKKTVVALRRANKTIRLSEAGKRDAEASAEAKTDFLANMSHEIMTPVNGMLGMLSLLKDTRLHSDQEYYVDTAHQSASLLLGLLDNSLNYTKLEKGIVELESNNFDLLSAIEDVSAFTATPALNKGIEVFTQLQPNLNTWVCGDQVRFKQLLFNLIGNAVKYTREGYIAIHYQLLNVADNSRVFRFEIKDTGIGIPESRQSLIFKRFYQIEPESGEEQFGTGLGLALCKQLVKLMRGSIGVDSSPTQGTTFWVELPFDEATQPSKIQRQDTLGADRELLLLDQDNNMAPSVQAYFTTFGFTVNIANSYQELYHYIEKIVADGTNLSGIIINMNIGMSTIQRVITSEDVLCCIKREQIVLMGSPQQRRDMKDHALARQPFLMKTLQFSHVKTIASQLVSEQSASAIPTDPQHTDKTPVIVTRATVLVVDDNKINQQVAVGRLNTLGCIVEVASSGAEALELLKIRDYDLVFMDCNMPVMSGFDAARKIRAQAPIEKGRIPIIAVTAHVMDDSKQKCFEAGMDDFIAKPFKTEELQTVLDYWLNQHPKGTHNG